MINYSTTTETGKTVKIEDSISPTTRKSYIDTYTLLIIYFILIIYGMNKYLKYSVEKS